MVFAGWKGDRKACKEAHAFTSGPANTDVCKLCGACTPFANCRCQALTYADCNPTALWLQTLISHETYMARTPAAQLSPYAMVPGWRTELKLHDMQHDMFFLFSKDACGTAVAEFVENLGPRNIQEEALNAMCSEFKSWCRDHGLSGPGRLWTLASIGWGDTSSAYPCMGSAIKAADMEAGDILGSSQNWQDCHKNLHDQRRACCMFSLASFIRILDTGDTVLSDDETTRAQDAGDTFLRLCQSLPEETQLSNKKRWLSRPKRHYFMHLVMNLKDRFNPWFFTCFMHDDFMGEITRIATQMPWSHCDQAHVAEVFALHLVALPQVTRIVLTRAVHALLL